MSGCSCGGGGDMELRLRDRKAHDSERRINLPIVTMS